MYLNGAGSDAMAYKHNFRRVKLRTLERTAEDMEASGVEYFFDSCSEVSSSSASAAIIHSDRIIASRSSVVVLPLITLRRHASSARQ